MIVDMCPKPNNTASPLSRTSHVEDLTESIPNLFQVLTAEPDSQQRWLTFTFPVDFDISLFKPKFEKEMKYRTRELIMICLYYLYGTSTLKIVISQITQCEL